MLLVELFVGKKDMRTKRTVWVILHTGDKVILGKRSPAANNPNQWNFFGGHVDKGETDEDAAVRELEEETNFKLNKSLLKKIAIIGNATYFSARVPSAGELQTTSEISSIKRYKITDLPDNLHSKTQTFFDDLDRLL